MFFFFCEFKEAKCSLGGLLLCKSTTLYFVEGQYFFFFFFFWHGSLNICCLFLQCEWAIIPRVLCVSQEKEAMGRTSSQCLVAELLTAASACRKVVLATPNCRALGSGNEP